MKKRVFIREGARAREYEVAVTWLLDCGLVYKINRVKKPNYPLFEEFKGALTEQYVMQQLIVNPENDLFYWSSDKGTAEVDFILQNEEGVIPIEVKAEENLQAKSLRVFCDKYHPDIAVRTSMSDYREQEWMVNIPLYLIGNQNSES